MRHALSGVGTIKRIDTAGAWHRPTALRWRDRLRFIVTQPTRNHALLPSILLAIGAVVCLATAWAPPAGRQTWLLEVLPGLLGIALLLATYSRFPMSHWVYCGVFVHLMILVCGAYYSYSDVPLGNWARDTFHLARNHYDRIGHIALGVFPAFVTREVLLRRSPLRRGGWLFFIASAIVFAVAAFWELLEWWVTLLVAPDVGTAFLGTQGDPWDAQWDMFLALLGAIIALAVFGRFHDRSMARVPGTPGQSAV